MVVGALTLCRGIFKSFFLSQFLFFYPFFFLRGVRWPCVCGCCHSVWRKPPPLCPACVFSLVQECPCCLGVLDLCHLCSFDISVLSLLSMCHMCFYVVTLSCLCLPSSAGVFLLPGCPHSHIGSLAFWGQIGPQIS